MKNKIKLFLVCIGMLVAGICYIAGTSGVGDDARAIFIIGETQNELSQDVDPEMTQESEPATETGKASAEAAVFADAIFVHVCGQVVSPGVYELQAGSRAYQAVELAGGFTDEAAGDFLNMAQVLEDGMKLEVPDRGAALELREQEKSKNAGSSLTPGESDEININTATKEQLMTLKGIGEARAEDIISYRESNGPFNKIEEIMGVSGIKEAAFQKIREKITV